MYRPTAKGYFSGAGGMELGLQLAGVNVMQSVDLDKDATDCMGKNPHYFSHKVILGDVTQMTVLDQPKSDVIVGTYPCTKYSAIADIHKARTGDDLFLHFLRHIVLEKPEMYVVENVPGMKKFKVVMEAMTKLPDYYVNVFCPLDASLWLPQRRKRLILIGTRKPFHIQEPGKSETAIQLKDIVETGAEVNIPDYVKYRLNGKYRDRPIIVDPEQPGAIAPTCVAHYAKDRGTRLVKDGNRIRPFTVREYARLQGFPDDFHFDNELSSYKLIGNAVPVHMAKWVGSQVVKYFN